MASQGTTMGQGRFTPEAERCSGSPRRVGRDLDQLLASIGRKLGNRVEHEGNMADRRARAARAERVNSFIASIGPRYKSSTLDSFRCEQPGQREVVDRLRRYVGNWGQHNRDGNGILLVGPVGSGKTHLGIATARAILEEHDTRVRRVSGSRLFAESRDAMGKGELAWIADYIFTPILLLDDPVSPAGPLTDHQGSTLMTLLDERNTRNRPTFATLNVASDQEAVKRLTAPVWDRLIDRTIIIRCDWPSQRRPLSTEGPQ